jgi:twinkle protein
VIRQLEADLLEARGLDIELVARLGVESCSPRGSEGKNWIMIPFREAGRIVNRKYRAIGGAKAFAQDTGGKQIFWNVDVIADETLSGLPLVITEGEFDAIAAIQAGYVRTVSVPNGAPAQQTGDELAQRYRFLEQAPQALSEVREIILATDNDDPGVNLLNDLALRLGKARCKWVQYPRRSKESVERCKDLNEALMLYGIHGLTQTLAQAQWMHVDGVYRMSELPPLPECKAHDPGIPGLSAHYKIRTGDFAVITGIPSHGKSSVANDIACRMASNYGWCTAFASFEQTPQRDHRRALRTWYNGKFEVYQSPEELSNADAWIDRHFVFLVPSEDDDVTLAWLLERLAAAVIRYGVKMVIVDPYNEMDHDRPAEMTETEYTGFAIKQFKKFARKHGVHFVLVAHPAKQWKDETGKIPIPTLYDISGSAHFYNKSDVGVVVHRADDRKTLIRVAKSRYHTEIGVPGDLAVQFDPQRAQFDRFAE